MDTIGIFGKFDVIDKNTIDLFEKARTFGENNKKKLIIGLEKDSLYFTQEERKITLSNIKLVDEIYIGNDKINFIKDKNITIFVTDDEKDTEFEKICSIIVIKRRLSTIEKIVQKSIVENMFIDTTDAEHLYELMYIFDKIFRDMEITYFAIGGTLLGALRNKGLIPWDSDLDIAILKEDIIKLTTTEFKNTLRKYGIRIRRASTCYVGKRKNVSIDIFPFQKNKEDVYGFMFPRAHNFWPKRVFNKHDLFPLKKYDFGKIKIFGPKDPDNFFKGCGFGDYMNEGIIGLSCHKEKYQRLINYLKRKNLHIITSKDILYKQFEVIIKG